MAPSDTASARSATESSPIVKASSADDPSVEVWGVLNTTPDSFSDGGRFLAPDRAIAHALDMVSAGADRVDVGGASSRPRGRAYGAGAPFVDAEEERARVEPVVAALCEAGVSVSIDTTEVRVAEAAVKCGARVVNDVSCARSEALLRFVGESGVDYVLMHTRGDGATTPGNTRYDDCVQDVVAELQRALARLDASGVPPERVWLDPGLGFAKTAEQSLSLLAATGELVALGHRVLVGPSRKAFIAAAAPRPGGTLPPTARQPGTDAAVAAAVLAGASAVRVHDVAAGYQAARVALALRRAARGRPAARLEGAP